MKGSDTHGDESIRIADALIRDLLDRGLDIRIRVTGRSMRPLVASGDMVRIRRVPVSTLTIGDLVLFKNQCGDRVLHRILRIYRHPVGARTVQTKGDARIDFDPPVPADRILGRVFHIEKNVPGRKPRIIRLDTRAHRQWGMVWARCQWLGCKLIHRITRKGNAGRT